MQAQNVYFISGLGADKRLFKKLKLPENFNVIHIDWIAPANNETIFSYASRLSRQIDTSQPFHLIGLSFGGMVVSELTKLLNPVSSIIISSASSAKEIPWYYKIAGLLRLPVLIPAGFLKFTTPFTYWLFGAKTKEEKRLLKQVLKDTDNKFLKWALTAISLWNNNERLRNLFHIHGSADKILPLNFIAADYIVKKGEHLMVYSESQILSEIIMEKLSSCRII